MGKILSIEQVPQIAKLHEQHQRLVLAGGCFDILHIGHITFLEKAKEHGDKLVIFLESDETITDTKGPKRPVNSQSDRAKILAALTVVDYVIVLKPHMKNSDYDELVFALKPAIIATTSGDSNRHHKERVAKLVDAKVVDVLMPISDKSTTALLRLLNEI